MWRTKPRSKRAQPAFAGAWALGLLVLPAFAHEGGHASDPGLLDGLGHPFGGLDHMLAMLAVGLWGSVLGRPAIWLLPLVFPMVMALGGVLAILGLAAPAIETGVAASALALGLVVAKAWKPPLAWAGALVALFGFFHGQAHGIELPGSADPLAYSLGFVLSTGALHGLGIAFGALARGPRGRALMRSFGWGIAAVGVVMLAMSL